MFYPQCPKCDYEGAEDYSLNDPAIICCPQCGHIYSFIWCETCGIGGDFIEKIYEKPTTWTCEDCHTTQPISNNVYDDIENLESARYQEPIKAYQSHDARNIGFDSNSVKNPYRQPKFLSLAIVVILALGSMSFVESIALPLAVMLLALTAMFGYIVYQGYKTGMLPLRTGELILRKDGATSFKIFLTFFGLGFIFLATISILVIVQSFPF